jgi:hypothetical protein
MKAAAFTLVLIAIALWGGVKVWDFRAKETSKALSWSRLLAPIAVILLCAVAAYLMSQLKR